jgi:hypothetical protein
VEYAGRRAVPEPAAKTPRGPLYPHQRHAQKEQGNEIGYHESPAAVIGGLDREPEEITQADRAAGDGHYYAELCCPRFALFGFSHKNSGYKLQVSGQKLQAAGFKLAAC